MGTSISQRSPSGNAPGGKEWTSTKADISIGAISSSEYVGAVARSFQAQYGNSFSSKIIDSGVRCVKDFLQRSESLQITSPGQFFIECRKELSRTKTNSFFAELALTKATACISEPETELKIKKFNTDFLVEVINYILSRDFPDIVGQAGLPSIQSIEEVLKELRDRISKEVTSSTNLEEYLQIKAKARK